MHGHLYRWQGSADLLLDDVLAIQKSFLVLQVTRY
jgi:hypothetical protein